MVGHPDCGAAAAVFAIDAASGELLVEQPVSPSNRGVVGACWAMVLMLMWIGLGGGFGRMGCRPRPAGLLRMSELGTLQRHLVQRRQVWR